MFAPMSMKVTALLRQQKDPSDDKFFCLTTLVDSPDAQRVLLREFLNTKGSQRKLRTALNVFLANDRNVHLPS